MNSKQGDTIPAFAIKIISGHLECGLSKEESREAFKAMCTQMHIEGDEYKCRLKRAITLNIVNRKVYSANRVVRIFELDISESTFKRYKRRYCYLLSKRLNLV